MTSESVLVIAFDGMDKELVEKFDLDNISQSDFGSIDNSKGISEVMTSELFASFITGEDFQEHGVKGLTKWENKYIDIFEKNWGKETFLQNFYGFRKAFYESLIGDRERKYRKEDLECETLFEKIDNSKPLFVPSYNPSILWVIGADHQPLEYGYNSEETLEYYDSREFENRKRNLFKEVNKYFDFLMCHFHRPDTHQHLYGDKEVNYEEDKLENLYLEMDDLAGQIIEFFSDSFDKIIFMSDHGLVQGKEHNENAFYSCNEELFSEEPRISDFHDRILDLVNSD